MLFDPRRIDAAAPAGPGIVRMEPSASNIEIEVGIDLRQFAEFGVEDDVIGRAHAIENGDARLQMTLGGLAHEASKRRYAGTACNANKMLVWFQDRQESACRRDNTNAITFLAPIHNARAHFSFALDGHFIKPAVQRAG